MAGTFVVSNGNTTIKLEYTAETATVQSIAGDAANYLWDKGKSVDGLFKGDEVGTVFGDLTAQQKLDLIDAHVKNVITDLANTYKSVAAQDAARATEAASEYSL